MSSLGNSAQSRLGTPRTRGALIVGAVVIGAAATAAAVMLSTVPPPAAPPASVASAGPVAGAPAVAGSEVQAPEGGSDERLPVRPAAAAPPIAAPLPATAAAQGEIVAGFPADLAGPLSDSAVIDSAVASEAATVQVSLRARTDAPADAVLAAFAERWRGAGLADAGAERPTLTFADATTTLTLTVDEATGTGTVYTVYGVLRVG